MHLACVGLMQGTYMVSSCALLGPAVDLPPNTLVHVLRATLITTNVQPVS